MTRIIIECEIRKFDGFLEEDFVTSLATALSEEKGVLEAWSEVKPNTYRFSVRYEPVIPELSYRLILGCFSPVEYDKVDYVRRDIITAE